MKKEPELRLSPHDGSIWPPHAWLFVVVSMLLTIGHGLSGALVFFLYLDLPAKVALALLFCTGIAFFIANIRLTRGHRSSLLILELLAVIYLAVAISSLFGISGTRRHLGMSMFMIATSSAAWISIRSAKYRAMFDVIEKRWAFYRATGRTILEEIERQEKDAKKKSRRSRQAHGSHTR